MTTLLFTDILTKETFTLTCDAHLIHNIETLNKELSIWVVGRILTREEI